MCVFVKIVLFEQRTKWARVKNKGPKHPYSTSVHPYRSACSRRRRVGRRGAAAPAVPETREPQPSLTVTIVYTTPNHSGDNLYESPTRHKCSTSSSSQPTPPHINRANHIHTRSTHARTRTSTKTQAGAHHKHIPYTPSYYSHETEMGAFVVSSAAELDTDVGDVFCGIRCDGGAPLCDAEPIPSSLSASSSLCSCAASRMEIMFVWPKCLARSIADLPSLSLRSGSAPASTRHLQAVSSPFETAQCSGVQPTVVVFCREQRRERV